MISISCYKNQYFPRNYKTLSIEKIENKTKKLKWNREKNKKSNYRQKFCHAANKKKNKKQMLGGLIPIL